MSTGSTASTFDPNENSLPTVRFPYRAVALLSAIGILLSLLLTYHQVKISVGANSAPLACNLNAVFNCDAVAQSAYAVWFGIPVSGYAALYHLLLLLLVIARPGDQKTENILWSTIFFLLLPGAGVAITLFGVSLFKLKTFCLYCLALDVVILLLFTLTYRTWTRLPKEDRQFGICVQGVGRAMGSAISFRSSSDLIRLRLSLFVLLLGAYGVWISPTALGDYLRPPKLPETTNGNTLATELLRAALRTPPESVPIHEGEGNGGNDFLRGPSDALLTVIEFSDFQCPACQRAWPAIEEILSKNPDVRFVFKNFPLDHRCNPKIRPLHEFACEAAAAARCAGEQGDELFWAAAHELFTGGEVTRQRLDNLPKSLGLQATQFDECMKSGRGMKGVERDVALGDAMRIQATPTVLVNGYRLPVFNSKALELLITHVRENVSTAQNLAK